MWEYEYSHQTSATPEALWRHWADMPAWPQWNDGIETIDVEGPFAVGTTFTMTPPGDEPIRMRLVEIEPVLGPYHEVARVHLVGEGFARPDVHQAHPDRLLPGRVHREDGADGEGTFDVDRVDAVVPLRPRRHVGPVPPQRLRGGGGLDAVLVLPHGLSLTLR